MANSAQTEIDKLYMTAFNVRVLVSIILAPINILGSTIILKAIHGDKDLHKISTFYFIANLAISDLVLSVFSCPLLAVMKFDRELTMAELNNLCTVFAFFFIAKRLVSAFTLTVLSLDKVFACIFHLKYNNFLTASKACTILVLIWVISFGISFLHWSESDTNRIQGCCRPNRSVLDTAVSLMVLLSFLVIFASNMYLMILSREHQKQDREQRGAINTITCRTYDNYQSLRSFFLLLCMFGFGLLPLVIFSLIKRSASCDSMVCIKILEYLSIVHYFDLNTRFIMYCCRFKSLQTCVFKVLGFGNFRKTKICPASAVKRVKENGVANVTLVDEMQDGKIHTLST